MAELSTVLIVEDDKVIRQMLRESLQADDFVVLEASKGQRAVEILNQHPVDSVLLDLGLPDAKGLEFIAAIKACTSAPLLIVSGEQETRIKIDSLADGADDFISKPIHFGMLNAKMKAQIRRYKSMLLLDQDGLPHIADTKIAFDKWVLDKEKFQLFDHQDHSANLTLKEFLILSALIKNHGKTLSRTDLCEVIKEQNYIPTDRAIDVKITRIRKKIGDDAARPAIIQTVRGAGYVFNAEIAVNFNDSSS